MHPPDPERVARMCDERAASYGALRRSALTAITLDTAAAALRAGASVQDHGRQLAAAARLLEGDADRLCGGREHQQRSRDAAILYGYADRIRALAKDA